MEADEAIVFFNPEVIEHKKLPPFEKIEVEQAFNQDNLVVYTNSEALVNHLKSHNWRNSNLLIMTSGNFSGVDLAAMANELIWNNAVLASERLERARSESVLRIIRQKITK